MAFVKKLAPIPLLLTILFFGAFLRFQNLGYSEFQDDEKKAFIRPKSEQSVYSFFMDQRKGPMQFLVTEATKGFVEDTRNEFAFRLPFAVINLVSVLVFYLLLKELLDSHVVAALGSLIYLSNGFVVGFSRIVQYQNINLLFSLLAVYFFMLLSRRQRGAYLFSLLGTLSFSVSLLAHWDAIFFVVPIIYFYGVFLLRKDVPRRKKVYVTVSNLVFGCVLLLPFLVPYIQNQLSHDDNVRYFGRRVGKSELSWARHQFIFELYNPFVTLLLLPLLSVFSLFKYKKSFIFVIWFVVNLLAIKYFMEKPGTHIYNYVIPVIFLASFGISALYKFKPVFIAVLIPLLIAIAFLYYQSYMLFVDHNNEYPWDGKLVLHYKNISYITAPYSEPEILTFGFPHYRNWKEINRVLNSDPDNCSYISNEGKEITQIYMDQKYGIINTRTCYYIVDVVRPFNIRGDGVVYAQIKGKEPVYVYSRDDEDLVKVYKIIQKQKVPQKNTPLTTY